MLHRVSREWRFAIFWKWPIGAVVRIGRILGAIADRAKFPTPFEGAKMPLIDSMLFCRDAIGGLDLKAHGKPTFENGMVVLNRAYLISKNLTFDLKQKSLEANVHSA